MRVLSPKTAQAVREMLQLATGPGGTAPKAQTMGYSVGGKTGTAYKQEGKGYAKKKYRAWFVGMAPINNPRIIVAVMVDEPNNGKYFGGDVAAPVFSEVVQQTLRTIGVQPDLEVKPQIVANEHPGRGGELLMALQQLALGPRRRWPGWRSAACAALTTDSRRVQPGDAFIAWPGHAHDGRALRRRGARGRRERLPGRGRRRRGLRVRRRRASPRWPG